LTTTWSRNDALCVTGAIPALPAKPTPSDYDYNWGIHIGVNATPDEPTDVIGRNFTAIAFTFSGVPGKGVRAVLHRQGDPSGTQYCFDEIASGQNLDITRFSTACSDGTIRTLTIADTPFIDKVGLRIPSASAPITVTDFCLTGLTLDMTGPAALAFDPATLDVGPVAIGASKAVQVVLVNRGPGPAAPLTLEVDDRDYVLDRAATTCKTILAAGDSCVAAFTFTPKMSGTWPTRIMARAPGGSAQAVVYRGIPAATLSSP
jgi:hypothetical protein